MPAPDRKRRLTALLVAMAVLVATPLVVVAADAFDDVPDTNVFHEDIAWLADAGVTKGCNPPDNTEFCPSDNVTREQMSAFMRRLAQYMDAEDGTPGLADHATTAGDADTLDGESATAYMTVVAADGCRINSAGTDTSCGTSGAVPDETTVELASASLAAPGPGTLLITGHLFGNTTTWFTLDAACAPYVAPSFTEIYAQAVGGVIFGGPFDSHNGNTAVNVPAGSHTVRLCGAYEATDGGGSVFNANVVAQWTASGSVSIAADAPDDGTPLDIPGVLGG